MKFWTNGTSLLHNWKEQKVGNGKKWKWRKSGPSSPALHIIFTHSSPLFVSAWARKRPGESKWHGNFCTSEGRLFVPFGYYVEMKSAPGFTFILSWQCHDYFYCANVTNPFRETNKQLNISILVDQSEKTWISQAPLLNWLSIVSLVKTYFSHFSHACE